MNYLLFLCKCMHLSMEILKEKLVLPTNRLFCDCYMFHSRHRMFNIFYGFFKDNHKKYGKFNYHWILNVGVNFEKGQYIHDLKILPLEWKGKNSNYTVEKSDNALAKCSKLRSPMVAEGHHALQKWHPEDTSPMRMHHLSFKITSRHRVDPTCRLLYSK